MDEVLKEYGMRLLVNEETGVRMQLVSIIGEIEGHESASSQTKTTNMSIAPDLGVVRAE